MLFDIEYLAVARVVAVHVKGHLCSAHLDCVTDDLESGHHYRVRNCGHTHGNPPESGHAFEQPPPRPDFDVTEVTVDVVQCYGGQLDLLLPYEAVPIAWGVAEGWGGFRREHLEASDCNVGVVAQTVSFHEDRFARWQSDTVIFREGLVGRLWSLEAYGPGRGAIRPPSDGTYSEELLHNKFRGRPRMTPFAPDGLSYLAPERHVEEYGSIIDDLLESLVEGTLDPEQEKTLGRIQSMTRKQATVFPVGDIPPTAVPGRVKARRLIADARPPLSQAELAHLPQHVRETIPGDKTMGSHVRNVLVAIADEIPERMMAAQMLRQYNESKEAENERKKAEEFRDVITLVGTAVLVPGLVASVFGANVAFRSLNTGHGLTALLLMMLALAIISGTILTIFTRDAPEWWTKRKARKTGDRASWRKKAALLGLGGLLSVASVAVILSAPKPSPQEVRIVTAPAIQK